MLTCKNVLRDCKSVAHPVSLFLLTGVKLVVLDEVLSEFNLVVERGSSANVRFKNTYASLLSKILLPIYTSCHVSNSR